LTAGEKLDLRIRVLLMVSLVVLGLLAMIITWSLTVWSLLGFQGWETLQSWLWQNLPTLVISYFFLAAIYAVTPNIWNWFLRGHRWLATHFFQEAINCARFSVRAIITTSLFLNFSFSTLVCLLPFRELIVGAIPMLKPAEPLIPPSIEGLLASPGILLLYILTVLPGPSLVFVVRLLRDDDPDVGGRLFQFLQILFYAAIFLAIFVWRSGSPLSGIPFEIYVRLIVIVLLPANIGGAGLMILLLASQAEETHLHNLSDFLLGQYRRHLAWRSELEPSLDRGIGEAFLVVGYSDAHTQINPIRADDGSTLTTAQSDSSLLVGGRSNRHTDDPVIDSIQEYSEQALCVTKRQSAEHTGFDRRG